jgi:hypothetical protein
MAYTVLDQLLSPPSIPPGREKPRFTVIETIQKDGRRLLRIDLIALLRLVP